ncbi:MAG: antitermination protein NusG [Ilumatobacteraceae bacterium]
MLADEYLGLFSQNGLGQFGFRWLHILAGIMWIGLLYYFNFVQVPAFAAFGDEGRARNIAIDKVARKALWWFRWAAVSTFLTGIIITVVTPDYFGNDFGKNAGGIAISTGMLLGIIMMLNVWGVIWRNQKVVLANAVNVLNGGEADPNAAAAGRRAVMASRQNAIFSVSMLFFMVYKGHAPAAGQVASNPGLYWAITVIVIAILELNALGLMPWKTTANKGLNKLYDGTGVRNPLIAAFGLWVIFLILSETVLLP